MVNNEDDITIISEDGRSIFYNPSSDEKVLAMLIFVLSFFTSIIGPLIIWLIKRSDSAYIDYYGKEYFNMMISYFVYGVIVAILSIIGIGLILAPILGLMGLIFTILAAIKASQGEYYRIPLIFRLIN